MGGGVNGINMATMAKGEAVDEMFHARRDSHVQVKVVMQKAIAKESSKNVMG